MRKKRLNVFLTQPQENWLRAESEISGLAVSDLIRRAVEYYITEHEVQGDYAETIRRIKEEK